MNTNFYKFICTQLIPEGYTLNIKNELIHISLNGLAYQEPEFSVDANFNIEEIELLNQISNLVDNNTFDIKAGNFKDLKILKLWYLITHEKYLKTDIVYDKYDRIGIENVKEDFLTILKVPIADVLKKKF